MKKDIMHNYTENDHRIRLLNIKLIENAVERVANTKLVTDYIQGQFIYPNKTFGTIEEDEAMVKMLAENGIGLIQIWEDMGTVDGKFHDNTHRMIDGRMFVPQGERLEQTKRFIEIAHKYGVKVIPYTSTNFYWRTDETFEAKWALPQDADLCHLAHCSGNSPGWRAVILRQYAALLDEIDYDGIYIDCGYIRNCDYRPSHKFYLETTTGAEDDILAFKETPDYDGGMSDLLALIYGEVKSRGGILKLHKEGVDIIHGDEKLYDYLWVGEAVKDINYIRKSVKDYAPYVIPDYNFDLENDDERYIFTIPYLQFPVVRNGKMGIGAPDVGFPDFERQLKWLKLYRQMTVTGTRCYIDGEFSDIIKTFDKDVVVTAYVNTDIYFAVASYGKETVKVQLKKHFTEVTPDGENDEVITGEITLEPRTMKILKLKTKNIDNSSSGSFNLNEYLISTD